MIAEKDFSQLISIATETQFLEGSMNPPTLKEMPFYLALFDAIEESFNRGIPVSEVRAQYAQVFVDQLSKALNGQIEQSSLSGITKRAKNIVATAISDAYNRQVA